MKKLLLLLCMTLLAFSTLVAQRFVTVCSGNWDDPAVWSLNAVPGVSDSIMVGHYVYLERDLILDSTDLYVTSCAGICSHNDLTMNNCTFYSKGYIVADSNFVFQSTGVYSGSFLFTYMKVNGEGSQVSVTPSMCNGSKVLEETDCYQGFSACSPVIRLVTESQDCENVDYMLKSHCAQEGNAHLWYRNDTLLNEQDKWTMPVQYSGVYSCKIINEQGLVSSFSNPVDVALDRLNPPKSDTIAMTSKTEETGYVAYPNPFSKNLYFMTSDSALTINSIELFSVTGNLVGKFKMNLSNAIPLHFLMDGIYLISPLYFNGSKGGRIRVVKSSR